MEQLARDKVCHLAETEAVEKCQVLLTEVERGYEQNRKAELAAGAGVESGALREYMHATSRHLYFQRAELQLMLRQLRFCSSELKGGAPLPFQTLHSCSCGWLCWRFNEYS